MPSCKERSRSDPQKFWETASCEHLGGYPIFHKQPAFFYTSIERGGYPFFETALTL
ncbi:hypothetical protein LFDSGCCC_CDS0022 [Phage C75C1]|nr:hypothetical protein LFDSGCCC_CDS0022 [Phage C75C1]